jgi:thiol-disulfide isomerase/thioredoxin
MNTFRLAGLLVASLGLFFSFVRAQGPAVEETPRMKDLKVVVVDAASQQPVAGAEISTFGREPMKLTTDESGVAVLAVRANPPMPEKDTMFTFAVKAALHEPRNVEWFSDAGSVRDTLPAEYKVALRTGGTAGGVVRDERGAPVSGAKIEFYASGLRGRTMGRGDKLQQEYGTIAVSEQDALVTDEHGRWRKEHFPTEITQISIDVIRPEGARTRFISGTMYRGPNERGGIVDIAQLLEQSAIFTLKDGVTVRGLVVDAEGRPVSGVQLRARDAASRNQPHTFFTNSDGTFTLLHWDVSSVLVTAEKEGYQAKSATIAAGGDAGVGKIVLAPAKPLIVRLVGENDTPLAGAELQTDRNPSTEQIVNWNVRTDANGRAEWPTAPDKPVTIWITPPTGTHYPFRSARLVADGSEHVIRVRPGADKSIRVNFHVVDAETGTPVPKFEVWRRLANQAYKPWGEPAEKGEFNREMNVGELPNGYVPSYRLQVRAAGYTGWASETLDYSFGDQELTLKLVKGESTLANEPPPTPRAGTGIDGEKDPQLLVLAASVARLLETGDIGAFVSATNTSLDDWRRLLPPGAADKDLPLGPDPTRIIQFREKAITTSAQHVLELARRAGVVPGKVRFTVKSVSSPMQSQNGFKIAEQPVMMPFTMAVRVVLSGEPGGDASGAPLRGEYELSLGNARKFPSGWRTDDGVRWAAFPERVADEAIRRELSLANRIAPTTFSDQRTLSGMDDPVLLQFGTIVSELVRNRAVPAFIKATRLSRDETADFYLRTDRVVNAEMDEAYVRNSTGLAAAAQAMVAMQERMGIDLSDAKLTVKQVLAERPRFMRFGQVDGISTSALQITFAAETDRTGKSGQPLAGSYTVAIGNAMRVGERWVLVDDKIRFQEFPKGLVKDDELKHVELENYVAEHRALPPGYVAPDVSFIKLADNTSTSLSAYRGKVVVLEFWAVWCGPCQEPMEKLQHLRDTYPDWKDRVEVIALSIDEKAEEARNHLEKKGWSKTFNVWAGEGAWQAPAARAFRVSGVPTAYVLDREGRVSKAGHPASMDFGKIVDEELKKAAR